MKVTKIETLRCDAGWRTFSFLKVMTDEGLVGWSEFNESFGSGGRRAHKKRKSSKIKNSQHPNGYLTENPIHNV